MTKTEHCDQSGKNWSTGGSLGIDACEENVRPAAISLAISLKQEPSVALCEMPVGIGEQLDI